MAKIVNLRAITIIGIIMTSLFFYGCIERKLTIKTDPDSAVVTLNDEEIGLSPVTVAFNWYGDYRVRIEKNGCETINTHRSLKSPWYDSFPFDFFAECLWPGQITDSYEWNFKLQSYKEPDRQKLIEKAEKFKKQAITEPMDPLLNKK